MSQPVHLVAAAIADHAAGIAADPSSTLSARARAQLQLVQRSAQAWSAATAPGQSQPPEDIAAWFADIAECMDKVAGDEHSTLSPPALESLHIVHRAATVGARSTPINTPARKGPGS